MSSEDFSLCRVSLKDVQPQTIHPLRHFSSAYPGVGGGDDEALLPQESKIKQLEGLECRNAWPLPACGVTVDNNDPRLLSCSRRRVGHEFPAQRRGGAN